MKLLNFDLKEAFAIALDAPSEYWDLHNRADFKSISFDPIANVIVMEWSLESSGSVSALQLVFGDVRTLQISDRDEELPSSEDSSLASVVKVIPALAEHFEYRMKSEWANDEPFNLLFSFQSKRTIEIGAKSVELITVTRKDQRAST